jgi:poly-gamma-glutamate system protein
MNKNRRRSTPSFAPIYIAGAAGLLLILALNFFSGGASSLRREMTAASRLMARAEDAVRGCRAMKGVPVDEAADPNRTGLIGLETSAITTSLGNQAAKRTTTNPDFAALIVSLLDEAGVRRGDAVAVGASSSFPALVIATLAAARAMGVEPLVISSLGASEWGANIPAFNWLDMGACLRQAGVLDIRPMALAVGGDEDVGRDMSPAGRKFLRARIVESGIPFIEEPGLSENVRERLRHYEEAAGGRPIRAFVNVGGSWANIGTNAEVLKLRPGLLSDVFIPAPGERGVLQEMAARKVPVIHLLNVRGLCERYGLPWDPCPLPTPGAAGLDHRRAGRGRAGPLLSAAYVLFIAALLVFRRRFPGTGGP